MIRWVVVGLVLACAGVGAAAAEEGAPSVVIFPFDLIDDSHEGELRGKRADEAARIAMITKILREAVAKDGRYAPVDVAQIAAEIEKERPIYRCNGCEDKLATAVGARYAMIGTVQKVSNLILNINLYIRDVKAEKILRAMSVDIRGNTDASWRHGISYLIRNRLFADDKVPG